MNVVLASAARLVADGAAVLRTVRSALFLISVVDMIILRALYETRIKMRRQRCVFQWSKYAQTMLQVKLGREEAMTDPTSCRRQGKIPKGKADSDRAFA